MMPIEAPLDRYRVHVKPEWIDYNGHMNVAYYLVAFDAATDIFLDYVGLDDVHREATGGTTFSAEVHICYERELKEGDPLRIATQLLAFDEKRVRYFHRMFHATEGFQAATAENLSLHVDLRRRRVAPMPEQVRMRLDAVHEAHGGLAVPDEAGRKIERPSLSGQGQRP